MKFFRKLIIFCFSFMILMTPNLLFGQPQLSNPLGEGTDIDTLLVRIIGAMIAIGVPVATLFVVYTGFLFVTARGNPEKLTKAKSSLVWTLVGVLILFGAQVIATLIENTARQLNQP